jgi:hypothetical protein
MKKVRYGISAVGGWVIAPDYWSCECGDVHSSIHHGSEICCDTCNTERKEARGRCDVDEVISALLEAGIVNILLVPHPHNKKMQENPNA